MIKYYCDLCGNETNKNILKIKQPIDKDRFFNLNISCIGEITIDTDDPLMKTTVASGIICINCLKQFIK